ncbi:methionine aminotransferase [Elizabethkingia meningoseptica]|uniref:methionine aminotransferase n=1 Tax=Elizabethkingia meningoseptica TaxID=238 RepID=UPI000842295B|nr:methionine aminotransferase [Elizabethkingia meningoseptica]ODM54289.1 methionine aminotransferase [Elizabethkingia meningoseptica]OHT29515.1 methionine aminotransferase [Elizabethkingia meningoseptica]OPC08439.1 methionine aminotransferase [Elizabethkingia meningoseptica]
MPLLLNSKLPNLQTTIFTRMSLLAQQENAVNLSQGFPDFYPDEKLMENIGKYPRKGFNQYAPMTGVEPLRNAIAEKIKYCYGVNYNAASEVMVTAGATEALFCSIAALIGMGDEVIVFEPAYDSYIPVIRLFGGIPKTVKLHYPDYKIDWSVVKAMVTERTKMIIINNPNNPAGTVLNEEDIRQLTEIVENTNIIILCDDVYENIVFDGKKHLSLSQFPIRDRSIIVASFGKLYHITGWKLGYLMAPESILKEIGKVHQYNVFSVNTPAQYAVAELLEDPESYTGLPRFFQEKRDMLVNGLTAIGFDVLILEGTYFLSASYKKFSNLGDLEFAQWLTKEYKVATIPFSSFYEDGTDEGVIRFCFAKKNETLEQALQYLERLK